MAIDAQTPPVPMPITGWMTTSDDARIPYRMKGTGPALVMVHGWSQSGAMFQHQLEALSDRYTVIVPDMRGHGDAPVPPGGLRMSRLARDIDELLAHFGLARASMLGWSMGVSVLWAYVDIFGTDAVERFIFLDQPPVLTILPGMDEAVAKNAGALFSVSQLYDLCAALVGPDGEATRGAFVAGMVTKTIAPSLYEWILAEGAKTQITLAATLLHSHCTNDWRDILPRIDRPTLVLGGSVSHVDPRSQRYVQAHIAGAAYREFDATEGGAHFPFLEAPDDFNRVVGAFLDER